MVKANKTPPSEKALALAAERWELSKDPALAAGVKDRKEQKDLLVQQMEQEAQQLEAKQEGEMQEGKVEKKRIVDRLQQMEAKQGEEEALQIQARLLQKEKERLAGLGE